MRPSMRFTAAIELVLISPAALFLTAVLVGTGDGPQHGVAKLAHQIVGLYAGRQWMFWLLLVLMPLIAVVNGAAALSRRLTDGGATDYPHLALASLFEPVATLLVGWVTITAGAILGVVALHMLAN